MLRARDNPFSTDRVLRLRYWFTTEDWTRLQETLVRHRGRGAVVGEKGSGKTTLLEDLAIRLRHGGKDVTLIRLSVEAPTLPGMYNPTFYASLGRNDAVLLDGAEQLPLTRWWQFRWQTRRAGIVVITTHHAGRLHTLRNCTTSPELLCDLVSSLGQELSLAEAEVLHRRHRGNLRDAMRELYDRFAKKSAGALSFPPLRA